MYYCGYEEEFEGYLDDYLDWLDGIFHSKGYDYKPGIQEGDDFIMLLESHFLEFIKEIKFPNPQRFTILYDGTYVDLDGDFAETVYFHYQKCKKLSKIVRNIKG